MSAVYLDHAATTPMHPAAIEAMTAALATVGNASSLHTTGRAARRRMEEARETLARLRCPPLGDHLHRGWHRERQPRRQGHLLGPPRRRAKRRRIITSPVEHHAILDAVEWLVEHEGAEVTWLPRRRRIGRDHGAARGAEDHDDVALVSVMWANNEVGTIMPIAELAAIASEFDVPMHSDAIQAVGQLPVDFAASGSPR